MTTRHLHPYFWDIDLRTFEPRFYSEYTIGRILEYGDEAAVAWLKQNFTRDQIVSVIRHDTKPSRRSAGFWALVYAIPPQETAALKPDLP